MRIDVNEGTAPEEWRPVVGFEGLYEVSDRGQVRSLDHTVRPRDGRAARSYRGRVLKQSKGDRRHYLNVGLSANGEQRTYSVHRLVLDAFVGPCPTGQLARHHDDDKSNNYLSNLSWGTVSQNGHDATRNGRSYWANKKRCKRDHVLALPNLSGYALARGARSCLACLQAHAVATYRRKQGVAVDMQALSDEKYAVIMAGAAVT